MLETHTACVSCHVCRNVNAWTVQRSRDTVLHCLHNAHQLDPPCCCKATACQLLYTLGHCWIAIARVLPNRSLHGKCKVCCMALTITRVSLLQAWFQEVAWTEAEKPIKLAARAAMLPDNLSMARQPLFCFQTMLNLLYWSCLVYDHNRVCLSGGAVGHKKDKNRSPYKLWIRQPKMLNSCFSVQAGMLSPTADTAQQPLSCFQTMLGPLHCTCLVTTR